MAFYLHQIIAIRQGNKKNPEPVVVDTFCGFLFNIETRKSKNHVYW